MIQTNVLDKIFVLSSCIHIFRNFHLDVRKVFFTVQVTEWLSREAVEFPSPSSFPWEDSRTLWRNPMPCALGWLCFSREAGPHDPLWSLPTWPVLWFCDTENLISRWVVWLFLWWPHHFENLYQLSHYCIKDMSYNGAWSSMNFSCSLYSFHNSFKDAFPTTWHVDFVDFVWCRAAVQKKMWEDLV